MVKNPDSSFEQDQHTPCLSCQMMTTISPCLSILCGLFFTTLLLAADQDKAVAEHVGKLDQWFTATEASKISGKPVGEAQVSYLKSEKHPITETVEYAWEGGRTRQTTGVVKMTLPVADSIKVGWLRKATLQELKDLRSYTEGQDIPGVGEFAFLANQGLQYIFFKNGVRFSVWVNLSDDPKVNTAKAVEAAQMLLEKL